MPSPGFSVFLAQLGAAGLFLVATSNILLTLNHNQEASEPHSSPKYLYRCEQFHTLQACFDRVAETGGEAILPNRRMLVNTGLTLDTRKSVTITGEGARSELYFQNASGIESAVLIINPADIRISNLTLKGSLDIPTVGKMITVLGGRAVTLDHNLIAGANRLINGGPIAGVYLSGSNSRISVDHNIFIANGPSTGQPDGFDIVHSVEPSAHGHDIIVRNNVIRTGSTSISIGMLDVDNSEVSNNDVDQNNRLSAHNPACCGYAVAFYASNLAHRLTGNRVVNNRIRNTAGSGIYIQGSDRSIVGRNVIDNVAQQQSDISLPVGAIALNNSGQVTVVSNVVGRSSKDGISAAGIDSTTNTITRNIIHKVNRYGIFLRGTSHDSLLSDNVIDGATVGIVGQDMHHDVLTSNSVRNVRTSAIVAISAQDCVFVSNHIDAPGGVSLEVRRGKNNFLDSQPNTAPRTRH
jgi:parallel beta-helix repeat protein